MIAIAGATTTTDDMPGDQPFAAIKFSHAFQPIVDVRSKRVVSYEVLLRGTNNEPPGFVFNQINQQQLMPFDQYNREQALALAAKLGLSCSINMNFLPSSILFEEGRLLRDTVVAANSVGLHARQLVIEITEGELIHDIGPLRVILNELRKERVAIAIDDFGAGFSGLNMLASIHPDIIKIDMMLVRGIQHDGPRRSIVRAICSVCMDLGIRVLAEGVESEQEYEFLRRTGINLYQGNLFGRPGFDSLPEASFPE